MTKTDVLRLLGEVEHLTDNELLTALQLRGRTVYAKPKRPNANVAFDFMPMVEKLEAYIKAHEYNTVAESMADEIVEAGLVALYGKGILRYLNDAQEWAEKFGGIPDEDIPW